MNALLYGSDDPSMMRVQVDGGSVASGGPRRLYREKASAGAAAAAGGGDGVDEDSLLFRIKDGGPNDDDEDRVQGRLPPLGGASAGASQLLRSTSGGSGPRAGRGKESR
jgi:hypothetical protein